jgi:mRNA interferase MazF
MAGATEVARGQLWSVDFGAGIGQHPGLLVSRTGIMRRRWRATVALISSSILGLRTEVPVGPHDGLDHDSAIDCEELYTVHIDQLSQRLGELDQARMAQVSANIRLALDLDA